LIVLPNGVDLEYFNPMPLSRAPATLVFTGKMSYHANIAAALDLATQVMPLVWQQLPEARLTLVGKDPPPRLLALTSDPRITVTGTVPDIRPYLAQATLAISPMRYGVGIQNKVLEAMAMATPVVSTPQAVSALQIQPGQEALIAETAEAMAQAVITLLNNDAQRQRFGQAGRRYVENYHDWRVAAQNLEAVYRDAVESTQAINEKTCPEGEAQRI
jgi:glycosyltransferase involved in cell wall biosynthesis